MSFQGDVERFREKAAKRMDKITRVAFIEVSTRVIRRSPVGDADYWEGNAPSGYTGGRFRANWQASVNKPKTSLIDSDESPETSASTSTDSVGNASKKRGKKRYYLMNNLPYSRAIEDGHSSRQAPLGVVKIVVQEWPKIVKFATSLVKL